MDFFWRSLANASPKAGANARAFVVVIRNGKRLVSDGEAEKVVDHLFRRVGKHMLERDKQYTRNEHNHRDEFHPHAFLFKRHVARDNTPQDGAGTFHRDQN